MTMMRMTLTMMTMLRVSLSLFLFFGSSYYMVGAVLNVLLVYVRGKIGVCSESV